MILAPRGSIPLVDVRGLGRRIPNSSHWLYRNIDLNVAPGDRLALAGPTGSGKSLILRAIALLDPVDQGDIAWCGEPIRDASVPTYRRRVLYLQQGSPVIEGTVADNLKLPFSLHHRRGQPFPRTQARELVAGLGKDSSFLDSHSNNLSGGERQIVALLRALLGDPTVLLLDEPSAALDPQTTASLERLVQSWHSAAAAERAYIWVSHDPLQAERIADRVIYLKDGSIVRSS